MRLRTINSFWIALVFGVIAEGVTCLLAYKHQESQGHGIPKDVGLWMFIVIVHLPAILLAYSGGLNWLQGAGEFWFYVVAGIQGVGVWTLVLWPFALVLKEFAFGKRKTAIEHPK